MPTPRVVFEHVWSRAVTRQATWTDRVLTYLSAWPIYESQMPGGITHVILDRLGDGRAAFAGPGVEALFERGMPRGRRLDPRHVRAERQPIRARWVTCSTWSGSTAATCVAPCAAQRGHEHRWLTRHRDEISCQR
jgi:hypothetical protein